MAMGLVLNYTQARRNLKSLMETRHLIRSPRNVAVAGSDRRDR